jgi:hypothetical protein
MNGPHAAAAYAALYAPTADDLRRSLPDIADRIHTQLMQLHEHPCGDFCEQLAANLGGAQRAVLRFRERLLAEGKGDER